MVTKALTVSGLEAEIAPKPRHDLRRSTSWESGIVGSVSTLLLPRRAASPAVSVTRGGELVPKSLAALTLCASVSPLPCWLWSTAGTHLVLCGWLALLQSDPKCPGGCLLVLLDDVDAPGGSGGGDTVIWGWGGQREAG